MSVVFVIAATAAAFFYYQWKNSADFAHMIIVENAKREGLNTALARVPPGIYHDDEGNELFVVVYGSNMASRAIFYRKSTPEDRLDTHNTESDINTNPERP